MKNNTQKTYNNNKYKNIIDNAANNASKKGLINLDFLDQLPDDDAHNRATPFPYGRGRSKNLGVWS